MVRFSVINALMLMVSDPRVCDVLRQHADDSGKLPGRPSIAELVRAALGALRMTREPQSWNKYGYGLGGSGGSE